MRSFIWVGAMCLLAGCTQSAGAVAGLAADRALPVQAVRAEEGGGGGAPLRAPDVVFVPTPEERVKAMLELAGVQPGEKIYDLGCGDGRIAVAAARDYGARAVCIDIDPTRVREAQERVRQAGVEDLVEVRQADLFEVDFSDADVVTLYLLPSLNEKLRPKLLRDLRPGARIVSHAFDMGDWQPEKEMEVTGASIYLWRIPE